MKSLIAGAIIILPASGFAAGLNCSIHPQEGTPDSSLPKFAKISETKARKAAIAKIKAPRKSHIEGELEVEQGCLVYSFDIKLPGKSGIEVVMVDAGTGKVLSHTHESQKQEMQERSKEKN